MDDRQARLKSINHEIDQLKIKLNLANHANQLESLKKLSQDPNFWQDNLNAQSVMRQIAKLEDKIKPWQELNDELKDIVEIINLKDQTLDQEIDEHLQQIAVKFDYLKKDLRFIGRYDDHDAIISIFAGAGGTDAQDWTQMLLRMYVRYFESQKWSYQIVDESKGDEAGLKSVTLSVDGNNVYGKLKGEHGVHRLVRLSPFNADNLRQTSFAKVEVVPKIVEPEDIVIDENDLKVDVYRSGGHGGQSVNTTDSAVRITHLPTSITVAIQNERSQLQNREMAMTILRSKLAKLKLQQHKETINDLRGENQSAEWGNQIRNYVLHPYKQVKDLRTKYETSDPDSVLNGKLDNFIDAYIEYNLNDNDN